MKPFSIWSRKPSTLSTETKSCMRLEAGKLVLQNKPIGGEPHKASANTRRATEQKAYSGSAG